MLWIYLAVIAYLINAIVFLIDKFLLVKPLPNPLSYAFYTSILSVLVVGLLPFGVNLFPAPTYLFVSFISGLFFFIALIYFFRAIKAIDIIESAPAVGAISAVATLIFSVFIFNEHFGTSGLIAFFLLVIGAFLMSYFHIKTRVFSDIIYAGVFFGASSVALKYLFNLSSFVDGLFWSRLGLVLSALLVLIFPFSRNQVFGFFSASPSRSSFLFIFNKVFSGIGFIVLYYAVKIGSVVFVNALQGLQYVFILLIGLFAAGKYPMLFEIDFQKKLFRKSIAAILIFAGFFFLVF
jgi:drug/metabolite transporter (DMT)-like permease